MEELLRLRIKSRGAYSIYRLEKRGWNTLDVIRELQSRYGLRGISRAGLKDRYSLAIQYLSLPGKGPQTVVTPNYRLKFIGMADESVRREALLGNRFSITIRELGEKDTGVVCTRVPFIQQFGFANYYDEQRFGSARHGQGFIARKLIAGHYNGALKLYLATPGPGDDSATKRQKRELAANWGNWQACMKWAPFEARAALRHLLEHPRDFMTAVRRLPRVMLELFINAYQGWLWNEILAQLLEEMGVVKLVVPYSFGELKFYEELSSAEAGYFNRLTIPAPGPKAEFKSDRVARIVNEVLAREGLELKDLKLGLRIRGVFFKPYERPAIVKPKGLQISEPEPDELYPGKWKLRLSFVLPAGSYATILIKRLAQVKYR